MAISKSKKPQPPPDVDQIKSDVASFASSIGLSAAAPPTPSGFNDSDFRKTGPIKKSKFDKREKANNFRNPNTNSKPSVHQFNNDSDKNSESRGNQNPSFNRKPKPGVHPLNNSNNESRGHDKYNNLPKLPLVKASLLSSWYVDAAELEEKVIGKEMMRRKVGFAEVEEWKRLGVKKKELGERLMWQYALDYESTRGQNGDIKMLVATQRSGTAADKVSAFSVMVGENPVANLRSLDALLGMVTSKVGKRHALSGFDVLKELFISSLLPDRKLKTLLQQPLDKLPESKDGYSLLLFWYWEECLKQRYERFIVALEEASRDMLPTLKDRALKAMYGLLRSKSEQERRLLSALVNKLGDPENKAASNANYHLSKLLTDHPNMKAVVIDEVDTFLFRPHLGMRAKYHAVNFMSHIQLSHKGDGPKVAKRLIDVYFALFRVIISEASGNHMPGKNRKAEERKTLSSSKDTKDKSQLSDSHVEMDSRLLTALLTGVNRAFPYVSSNEADDIIEVQTPMLFQLVHSKNFNVGVQALMLLDKISSKNQIASDRFYRALYAKLLTPAAMHSSKDEMFIGLLLRAMKNDVNVKRVSAFSKRLLQVALQQPPQYACACLFLLSELLKSKPNGPHLWNIMSQSESLDDDIEHFEDVVEESENKPITKENEPSNVVESASDGDSSKDEGVPQNSGSESDVSAEEDELLISGGVKDTKIVKAMPDHQIKLQSEASTPKKSTLPGGYDPRHREPSYCNADRVSWWELTVLASHVHPSVATMARTLLSGANIVYNGNPLNDLSLIAFLDKFMEKKPKQSTWHGGSHIEPAKKLDLNNQILGKEILSVAETEVAPEDFVFHKFYLNKVTTSKKPKKKKKEKRGADDEDAEDLLVPGGDDESDSEEIEGMLDASNPSIEADGDYDYDDLDEIADEDDDDLVGNVSDDDDMDAPSDLAEGDEDDIIANTFSDEDDDVDDIKEGDEDEGSENDDEFEMGKRKRKRKNIGKKGVSPFASIEEYEHMLDDQPAKGKNSHKGDKAKAKKKQKMSKCVI